MVSFQVNKLYLFLQIKIYIRKTNRAGRSGHGILHSYPNIKITAGAAQHLVRSFS